MTDSHALKPTRTNYLPLAPAPVPEKAIAGNSGGAMAELSRLIVAVLLLKQMQGHSSALTIRSHSASSVSFATGWPARRYQ